LQPRHVALAIAVAFFWGLNFVFVRLALTDFPPLLLASLRFVIAALPVAFLPKPKVRWATLVAIGGTLFVGQFAFLFPAMAVGMPPGLASIALQAQAFITIFIAAIVLREKPTRRQTVGAGVALAGLLLVAATVGANGVTLAGFLLLLVAAVSWASGNVLLRRAGAVDMLSLMSWLSLMAWLPLLLLSLVFEGPARIAGALEGATWLTVASLLYIAVVSTIFGYAAWGHLLKLYPAATAAPFALLVPVSGTLSAALILGESFGPMRLAGMALIFIGLGILVIRSGGKREPEPEPGLPDAA
jgi:O-acetylserine/cysteine efflux transporter